MSISFEIMFLCFAYVVTWDVSLHVPMSVFTQNGSDKRKYLNLPCEGPIA